jgi:hypothetical protein
MGPKGRTMTSNLSNQLCRLGTVEAVELSFILNDFMRAKIAKGIPARVYRAKMGMERWENSTLPAGKLRYEMYQGRKDQAVIDQKSEDMREWDLRCKAKLMLGEMISPPPSPPPPDPNPLGFFRPWDTIMWN